MSLSSNGKIKTKAAKKQICLGCDHGWKITMAAGRRRRKRALGAKAHLLFGEGAQCCLCPPTFRSTFLLSLSIMETCGEDNSDTRKLQNLLELSPDCLVSTSG